MMFRCGLLISAVIAGLTSAQSVVDPSAIAYRLAKYKQSTLSISFKDATGSAIDPRRISAVTVAQPKPALGFGVALRLENWSRSASEKQAYLSVASQFNSIVPENLGKWLMWEPTPGNLVGPPAFEEYLNLAQANGQRVRFHTIEWYSPKPWHAGHWSKQLSCSAYIRALSKRIFELGSAYKGKIFAWDVFNEVTQYGGMLDKCNGWNTFFVDAFKAMRILDPHGLLCLNEMVILQSDMPEWIVDRFVSILATAKQQGAPINCAGVQAHMSAHNYNPDLVWSRLNKIGAVVENIIITEYSLPHTDSITGKAISEGEWATATTQFLALCMSHPKVVQVDMWTFWDPMANRPTAGFYRNDWSAKAGAPALLQLANTQWRTGTATLTPNAQGMYSFWGYPGSYGYQVTVDGQTKTGWTWLYPSGTVVLA